LGLFAVPRSEFAAFVDVVGVVPDSGVPQNRQRVDDECERNGPLDREAHAVVGLADVAGLLRVFYTDLDGPARGVALDDLRGTSDQVGGDQRYVVAGLGLGPRTKTTWTACPPNTQYQRQRITATETVVVVP